MIRAENLWKTFGQHNAVRGLSLTVPEGSAYALIGANGTGKTTTIKILMNILKPSHGRATVLGIDSRKLSPRELVKIGYVSENQELPERLTVQQYCDYLRPFYPTWDRKLEASLRVQLQLPGTRRIGELSHGMRMKMVLACALPFRPSLLILDEPFSGLDPLMRDEFMDGVLRQAGEMTILISSHELHEIEGLATHVAFLDEGQLLFEEPMEDLSNRFRSIRVVFDQPTPLPENLSPDWLEPRTAGNILEFVDTHFSQEHALQRLESLFYGIRRVDVEPLPLRSIFTILARKAKDMGWKYEGSRDLAHL
jgi:ABC-2 type transport system ATP-binding protein